MNKINDLWQRAGKTFIQAFLGVLIPQVVLVLTNVLDYDWNNFFNWGLPIITGALAAGISAAWNTAINHLQKNNPEGNINNQEE